MNKSLLSEVEAKVIVALLELAAETFSNHSCNDFDLKAIVPDVNDRKALMQELLRGCGISCCMLLEIFDDAVNADCVFETVNDSILMEHMAHTMKKRLDEYH